jgi:hypothetical protein
MPKKLKGARGNKEIKLPEKLVEILPTTREAAVARLHFHFPKKDDYEKAIMIFDTYTLNDNIGQAYYRTVAKKGK